MLYDACKITSSMTSGGPKGGVDLSSQDIRGRRNGEDSSKTFERGLSKMEGSTLQIAVDINILIGMQ